MTWDKTKPAGSAKIRLSDEIIRDHWDHLEDALGREHTFPGTYGSTSGQHAAWLGVPSGTKMIFVAAAAPTGWTQDVVTNDKLLRIVSGATGGTTGGDWTMADVAVKGHALTEDEMPSHTHEGTIHTGSVSAGSGGSAASVVTGYLTGSAGGDQEHTHDLDWGEWRPAYIDAIICEKD